MERVLLPVLQFVIILTAVLTQRLDAALTSIDVNPRTTKHPPHDIDAVEDARLGDNHRIYAQSIECLEPRSPSRQFSVFDVVRKLVVSVLPAMLDALVLKYLRIVIEADA
jgi:hypothetical protein